MDYPETIVDICNEVIEKDIYKYLSSIGTHFNDVIRYGIEYNIDSDPVTSSIVKIAACVYYSGICTCMQLEMGLYLSELFNIEYEYAINTRAYLESVSKIHKCTQLARNYFKTGNVENLENGSKRLVATYSPDLTAMELQKMLDLYKKNQNTEELINQCNEFLSQQSEKEQSVRAYGIMSLVCSLDDKIPNIREEYDRLSEYLHGDFLLNQVSRKISFFQGMKSKPSVVIQRDKILVEEKLKMILVDDLNYLKSKTSTLVDRLYKKQNSCSS